jgi:hypothetical protein
MDSLLMNADECVIRSVSAVSIGNKKDGVQG